MAVSHPLSSFYIEYVYIAWNMLGIGIEIERFYTNIVHNFDQK
jgi:hypothetical protein